MEWCGGGDEVVADEEVMGVHGSIPSTLAHPGRTVGGKGLV